MRIEVQIPAADGFPLRGDVYESREGGPAVIINSAMGVRRQFYADFATFLASEGYTVITYDYRGISGSTSSGPANHAMNAACWGERDFAGVLSWASDRSGGNCAVIGHSIGGQIVGLAKGAERLQKIVLIAAQSGYWKHWPGAKRPLMWFWWCVAIPALVRMTGRLPMRALGQGEDVPAEAALEWAKWGRLRGYLFDPRSGLDVSRYGALDMHLTAYSFDDDSYAPLHAVNALLERFPACRKRHVRIAARDTERKRIGHFGFFKKDASHLWKEVAAELRLRQ